MYSFSLYCLLPSSTLPGLARLTYVMLFQKWDLLACAVATSPERGLVSHTAMLVQKGFVGQYPMPRRGACSLWIHNILLPRSEDLLVHTTHGALLDHNVDLSAISVLHNFFIKGTCWPTLLFQKGRVVAQSWCTLAFPGPYDTTSCGSHRVERVRCCGEVQSEASLQLVAIFLKRPF